MKKRERIEELERQVRELQQQVRDLLARPIHSPPPVFVPSMPAPNTTPWWQPTGPIITCGGGDSLMANELRLSWN